MSASFTSSGDAVVEATSDSVEAAVEALRSSGERRLAAAFLRSSWPAGDELLRCGVVERMLQLCSVSEQSPSLRPTD